jgi:hypothetical protein
MLRFIKIWNKKLWYNVASCWTFFVDYIAVLTEICTKGVQTFQKSRNHFIIQGAWRMKRSKFWTEGPQTLGATIRNLVQTKCSPLGDLAPGIHAPLLYNFLIFPLYSQPASLQELHTNILRLALSCIGNMHQYLFPVWSSLGQSASKILSL